MTEPEIRQYGQPTDCRGWRQFLSERACPDGPPPGRVAILSPMIIWVSAVRPNPPLCQHDSFLVHESTVRAICRRLKIPRSAFRAETFICIAQGHFLD